MYEESAVDLGCYLLWGKPTRSCLWPATDELQSKILGNKVQSWFLFVIQYSLFIAFCAVRTVHIFVHIFVHVFVHIFDFRYIRNGIHNKWQPVGKKSYTVIQTHILISILPRVVASVIVGYTRWAGQLHSLEKRTVDCIWNVMSHAQKPDFVFRRNGRVCLNQWGRQFSRLLAAEVCASAVVMLDTPCSEVVWRVMATHSIRQFPLHFPSRASPCAITFQLESTYFLHGK
jgi:hypothetical protein